MPGSVRATRQTGRRRPPPDAGTLTRPAGEPNLPPGNRMTARTAMSKRINPYTVAPDALKPMMALEESVANSGLTGTEQHDLSKIGIFIES